MHFLLKLQKNENAILCFHIASFILLISLFLHSQATLEQEVKAKEITAQATIVSKYFYDTGLAMGAYLLTKNQAFAERYAKLAKQIPDSINTLGSLAKGDPEAEEKVRDINKTATQGLDKLAQAKITADQEQSLSITEQGQARSTYKQIKSTADQLQLQLDLLTSHTKELSAIAANEKRIYDILSVLLLFAYVAYNFILQRTLTKTSG